MLIHTIFYFLIGISLSPAFLILWWDHKDTKKKLQLRAIVKKDIGSSFKILINLSADILEVYPEIIRSPKGEMKELGGVCSGRIVYSKKKHGMSY